MIQDEGRFSDAQQVEMAFYTAFRTCDLQLMQQVWAHDDVLCIHPGSACIVGHAAILRSWQHILSDAQLPQIDFTVQQRFTTDTLAVHVVEEHIDNSARVLATNIYRYEHKGWLMVEHHASLWQGGEAHTLQ